MSSRSILRETFETKPIYRRLKTKPASWDELFSFPNIIHNLRNTGNVSIGGCSVRQKGLNFDCFPISFSMPSADAMMIFPDLKIDILIDLASFQSVGFDDLKALVFYTHIELIADFLRLEEELFLAGIAADPRFAEGRRIRRPTLLEPAASSLYLRREEGRMLSNRRAPIELVDAAIRIGVQTLEVPDDYELERTVVTLDSYGDTLDSIGFPRSERAYNLKFRKLGSYKANGFYSEETNTVIVDPRASDVFYHELGHLIFDRKIPISIRIDANDSEEFAQLFYKHIKHVDWAV